jgi:hypothetical protein
VSAEEVPIVIDRMRFTPQVALNGPRGDVCPEPATFGAKLRHLGWVATSVTGTAIGGAQDGRQAFAVDRREVPP